MYLKTKEGLWCTHSDDAQKDLLIGKWVAVEKGTIPAAHRKDGRE